MRFARSDQSPNNTKETTRIEYEYVTIFYATGAVPAKIVQWNPNRPMARRANAILLWAQGKSKAEIVRLLQAVRSSVNRWIKWYLAYDFDRLQADWPGKKVRFPPTFIGELLKRLINFRPQDFGYQRSRWSSKLFSIVIREALNIVLHSSTIRR